VGAAGVGHGDGDVDGDGARVYDAAAMGDADRVMGLLQGGEDLTTFFRAQRKLDGILHDGILVLTNKRLLWVEEHGDPVDGAHADVVGAVSHEAQLALRFRHAWLALFFQKAQVAADAERQIGVVLKGKK